MDPETQWEILDTRLAPETGGGRTSVKNVTKAEHSGTWRQPKKEKSMTEKRKQIYPWTESNLTSSLLSDRPKNTAMTHF